MDKRWQELSNYRSEQAEKFYMIKHIKSELMRIMGNDRAQEIISR